VLTRQKPRSFASDGKIPNRKRRLTVKIDARKDASEGVTSEPISRESFVSAVEEERVVSGPFTSSTMESFSSLLSALPGASYDFTPMVQ
jgi:hypothetical protein